MICQEVEENGQFHVSVLDEIVLWNSLPEHAAQEFVRRYEYTREYKQPVFIYGDPAGLYGTGDGLVPSFYEKIRKVLIDGGFIVKVMMRKPDPDAINHITQEREKVKIPVAERIASVNAMLCNAEDPPKVRLKIMRKCENLIKSLEGLQFTEDGKNIDKMVDKKAGRSSNKEKSHLMTHPTDALGYYIYKRFPVIKNKDGVIFFQFPGSSITEYRRGKLIDKNSTTEVPEHIKVKREKRLKKRQERQKQRDKKQSSFKKFLDDNGLWGG